ncbi:MAG: A/G-specific adenine glycosylase [Spirochaetota bacterium]
MDKLLAGLTQVRESYLKKKNINATIKKKFLSSIYTFYDSNYRHLPWRNTDNPYHILVSEVMLQQTQVNRTIEKYSAFIKKFPTVEALAQARLHEVLAAWQGLGYNRRAKYLWQAAQIIVSQYNGTVPDSQHELEKLPGLGKATAASVAIFAFGRSALYIETNVRTVYIYSFFADNEKVSDVMIEPLLKATMDTTNPKKFYNALMDCGTYIKQYYNFSRNSVHYKVQTPYSTSLRKVRGDIVKYIVNNGAVSKDILIQQLNYSPEKIQQALDALCHEKLICESKSIYTISRE